MSNRDDRDMSKEPATDETATPDIGGAFGGSAGTMESRREREDYGEQSGLTLVQNRADALSRPPTDMRGGASDAVTYSPDAGTGAQGAQGAPMSQTDVRDTSTAHTDLRRIAADGDHNTGGNYVPDKATDHAEIHANLPERDSSQEDDAF